jgi:deazaflavin-dependent oxidoreductase (nitroreductase family)
MRSGMHAGVATLNVQRVRRETEARMQNVSVRMPYVGHLSTRLHARLYKRLGGRFVGRWFGGPVAVIETVGRKTGKPRAVPTVYAWDGEDVIVVGANAGNESPPAWFLNLRERPSATVVIGGERRRVRAREAQGEERERRLDAFRRVYPRVDDYRAFTDREFPVVVLEPER